MENFEFYPTRTSTNQSVSFQNPNEKTMNLQYRWECIRAQSRDRLISRWRKSQVESKRLGSTIQRFAAFRLVERRSCLLVYHFTPRCNLTHTHEQELSPRFPTIVSFFKFHLGKDRPMKPESINRIPRQRLHQKSNRPCKNHYECRLVI